MLLPDVLGQSLESIKRGELTVHFDLQHFERLVHQLTRAGNTLAVGIVTAGLLVGSSLILRVAPPRSPTPGSHSRRCWGSGWGGTCSEIGRSTLGWHTG